MGKSKRKYRQKNKRTRKKRGGLEPPKNKLVEITKNPDLEEQKCIQHLDPNNELYNKGPTWIQYLEAATKGISVTPKEKLAERKKWCGSKKNKNDRTKIGYCLSNSGTAEVKISNMTNNRCLPNTKKGKTCRIRLRPEDVYHCTKTCGRPTAKDKKKNPDLYRQKITENKLECNDAGVHIGNRVYSLVDSLEAIEKYDKEVKERKEKERKEKERKRIALAKAEAAAKKAREEEALLKEKLSSRQA